MNNKISKKVVGISLIIGFISILSFNLIAKEVNLFCECKLEDTKTTAIDNTGDSTKEEKSKNCSRWDFSISINTSKKTVSGDHAYLWETLSYNEKGDKIIISLPFFIGEEIEHGESHILKLNRVSGKLNESLVSLSYGEMSILHFAEREYICKKSKKLF